jgi:hypothetical protein
VRCSTSPTRRCGPQTPTRPRAERETRLRRRQVRLGRLDADGLRTLFARIDAGDGELLDDMLDKIADALADRPDLAPDLPEEPTRDGLRAEALSWLASPDDVQALLSGTLAMPEPTPDQPEQPSPGRQDAAVYVHYRPGSPVAEVEGLGPILLEDMIRLLSHTRVQLHPVIDLGQSRAVDGYPHPSDVRERTWLRTRGSVFPHAARDRRRSRRVDHDHPTPYDPTGPPGQTGDHNDAPLRRRQHRAKTHLGYKVTQLDLGVYLWRTPNGLWRLVDDHGTHLPGRL